jgi:hypothetical protein
MGTMRRSTFFNVVLSLISSPLSDVFRAYQ